MLSFTTGERDFKTSSTDTKTIGLSYVRISSARKDAFEFGSARTDALYYVTDSVAAGFAVQGAVFYQDPVTGNFVKYAHPNAVIEGGKVRVNYVKYRPSPSGASVDLEFLADGIEAGQVEPDFAYFVILVPEKVGAEMRYFMVDVGYGDQPKPHLGSPFEAGVTYG